MATDQSPTTGNNETSISYAVGRSDANAPATAGCELATGRERWRGRLGDGVPSRGCTRRPPGVLSGRCSDLQMEEKTGVLSLLFVFWVAAFSTFLRPFFVELLFASFIATVSSYLKLKRLPRRGSRHKTSKPLAPCASQCMLRLHFLSFFLDPELMPSPSCRCAEV